MGGAPHFPERWRVTRSHPDPMKRQGDGITQWRRRFRRIHDLRTTGRYRKKRCRRYALPPPRSRTFQATAHGTKVVTRLSFALWKRGAARVGFLADASWVSPPCQNQQKPHEELSLPRYALPDGRNP